MPDKQLAIPGLELPLWFSKRPKSSSRDKIASLETRVLRLELEVALLGLQLEGDNDHD